MSPKDIGEVELALQGTVIRGPQGPQGKDGIAGPPGNPGNPGAPGADGKPGLQGDRGDPGLPGKDGVDGKDGLPGDTGPAGEPGRDGVDGAPGLPGINGRDGLPGTDGQPGLPGRDGVDGLPGAKGDKGDKGDTGLKGDKGDTGAAGTGLNNRGTWLASTFNPGDYVFAAGSSATTSMWILSGNTPYVSSIQPNADTSNWIEFEAPAGADGEDGTPGTDGINGKNIELQKTGTAIQWRVSGGVWADLVLLSAITGPAGTPGIDGIKGDQGDPGQAGTPGLDGAKGDKGDKGDPGTAGTPGTNGTNGSAGVAGKTILTTSGVPAVGAGVAGDFAYDPTAQIMYGPKTTTWPAGVSIKGAKGDKGDKGDPGSGGGAGLPDGGTLGQILAKASVTDQDVAWVDPPAGGGGGGSAPLTDVRSASMNNNSTTLVKALGVAGLTSGKTYRVRILAHTMPSSPSVGIAIGFGGTFGASKIVMTARYLTAADTMSSKFMSEKGVTYTFPTSAQGSPHGCPLIIEGFIMCVGAGTFELHIGAVAAWEYWAFEAGSNLTVEALTTTV